MIKHTTRVFLRRNTRLKAFTGPVHCQKLSQNGHSWGMTNLFQVKHKTKIRLSAAVNTRPMFLFHLIFFNIFIYFFFTTKQFLRSSTWQKKSVLSSNTRPKIHKNQNISQVQFTTKHFLRSITQIKIYYVEQTTPKCFSVLIRQVEKRTNQLQEKNVRQTNRKFRVIAGQMEL